MVTTWPDLPSRTLLLTTSELTPAEAARIKSLGADVVSGPYSLASIEAAVKGRVQKARSAETLRLHRGRATSTPSVLPN